MHTAIAPHKKSAWSNVRLLKFLCHNSQCSPHAFFFLVVKALANVNEYAAQTTQIIFVVVRFTKLIAKQSPVTEYE